MILAFEVLFICVNWALIGGMSWYSTELYYSRINKQVLRRTEGSCNAPLLIESLNFCDIARAHSDSDWDHVADVLIASAKRLEDAGATALPDRSKQHAQGV
jgi:aspartate racemase